MATAPAPFAAAAAFAPAPLNKLAAAVGVLVLIAGIAGGITHIGLFFVPALVCLAVGGAKLWREPSCAISGRPSPALRSCGVQQASQPAARTAATGP